MGEVVLKKGYLLFLNYSFMVLSFVGVLCVSVWCAYACFIYLHHFSQHFLFHGNDLVLLFLIMRYLTSINE